jgi:histidinol-phosphate aminotransferase
MSNVGRPVLPADICASGEAARKTGRPTNPQPRAAVQKMAPYSPPSGGRAEKLRLDFNENTLGCSPKVIEYLAQRLTASQLSIYPEYADALQELASFFQVDPAEFILTNGTDEAIQVMINTFVDDGGEVITLKPSYAMYRFYAELAAAQVKEIEFPGDLSFPLDALISAITPSTKAILIANPNNPTGTGICLEEIQRILDAAPGAAVLIDEAYYEFCGVTALPWIKEHKNLFVSRTFSKVYGMAAMRCGCLFSAAGNVQWMHKAQSPYSVNTLAALAARAAVQDKDYVASYVAQVLEARKRCCEGLTRLGISYFPSQANFVLFQAGDRAIPIRDALRTRGVLVRDRSYEIAGCVRVTIGTVEQTERFLTALEELWTK